MDRELLSKRLAILKKINDAYDPNCRNCKVRLNNQMLNCNTSNCKISLKLRGFGIELDKLLPPRRKDKNKIESVPIPEKEIDKEKIEEEIKNRKAEYQKRYHEKNKDKKREYNNRYREKNKEKIANYHKKYYTMNKSDYELRYLQNKEEKRKEAFNGNQ